MNDFNCITSANIELLNYHCVDFSSGWTLEKQRKLFLGLHCYTAGWQARYNPAEYPYLLYSKYNYQNDHCIPASKTTLCFLTRNRMVFWFLCWKCWSVFVYSMKHESHRNMFNIIITSTWVGIWNLHSRRHIADCSILRTSFVDCKQS